MRERCALSPASAFRGRVLPPPPPTHTLTLTARPPFPVAFARSTPIFPPQWINTTDDSFYMVSTQCCGAPEFPPTNHYSFNAQKVTVARL